MAIAALPDESYLDAFVAARPALRLLPNPGGDSRAAVRGAAPHRSEAPTALPRSCPRRVRINWARVGVISLVAGSLGVLAGPIGAFAGTSHPMTAQLSPGTVYTVQPGDTLWSIAQRLDPSGDPRTEVARLTAQTGSDTVFAGEQVRLP